VHPAHQSTGVGRLLKFEQRKRARDMGLEAVVWAFDPLQASNAAFNLAVLGATCRAYEVDLYGSRSDALNAGLATDRLFAEWSTGGEPSGRTQEWPDGVDLLDDAANLSEIPQPASHLYVQIPPSIASVKTSGPSTAARNWQLAVRHAFQAAFDAGFIAVGFSRTDPDHPRYLLERPT
jgi:predicted GNAT superfamily acetyltransferase